MTAQAQLKARRERVAALLLVAALLAGPGATHGPRS